MQVNSRNLCRIYQWKIIFFKGINLSRTNCDMLTVDDKVQNGRYVWRTMASWNGSWNIGRTWMLIRRNVKAA